MIFQPFRGNKPAGVCSACGGTIYSGDLSFDILGETLCADCVESSGYIAGEELLDDINYLGEMYSPYIDEHMFDNGDD